MLGHHTTKSAAELGHCTSVEPVVPVQNSSAEVPAVVEAPSRIARVPGKTAGVAGELSRSTGELRRKRWAWVRGEEQAWTEGRSSAGEPGQSRSAGLEPERSTTAEAGPAASCFRSHHQCWKW